MACTPTTPAGQWSWPGSGGRHGPRWVCRGPGPLLGHGATPHSVVVARQPSHLHPQAGVLALLLLLILTPCASALAEPEWGTNYYRADPPRGESFSVDPAPRQPSQWSGNQFSRPTQERDAQRSFPQRPSSSRQWPEEEEAEHGQTAPPRVGEIPHDWRNEDFNQRPLPRQRESYRESPPREGYRDAPMDSYREPPPFGYGRAPSRDDPLWIPSERDLARDRWRWEGPGIRDYEPLPLYEGERSYSGNGSLRRRYPPNTYQSGEQWWEHR